MSEAITKALQDVIAAHDHGLAIMGEQMRDAGVTALTIGGPEGDAALKMFEAISAARAALSQPAPSPQPAVPVGFSLISDDQIAALELAALSMQAIADKQRLVGDVIEPVRTINDAAKIAKVASHRIANVLSCLDLNEAGAAVPVVSDEQIDAVSLDQWGPHHGAPLAAHRAFARAILALRQADHPDTQRCIKARNDLNAVLHGEGALIDDLENAVAIACAKLRRPAVEPMTERWTVVRETVLDVGRWSDVRTGGRPELCYALISDAATFDNEADAVAAINSTGLPVGWVVMPLSRLLTDTFGITAKAEGGA